MKDRCPTHNQLILVPIEPLTERYTEQWYRLLPEFFMQSAAFEQVVVVDGTPLLADDIKVGAFLDIQSTIHYKATQMQALSAMFFNNEVSTKARIFFFDLEFWGIESVRLMADMSGLPSVELYGFLHAASHTVGDAFSVAARYQQYTEVGWALAMTKVFVGSEYAKQAFVARRLYPMREQLAADNIVVTKNPVFPQEYKVYPDVIRENKILLTNRFDAEKSPEKTLRLFSFLKAKFPEWEFVVTTGRKEFRGSASIQYAKELAERGVLTIKSGLTKDQYHRELQSAKFVVSHSQEESYGYCIAEAILYGCTPFLVNCASHPEFMNTEEAREKCIFQTTDTLEHQAHKLSLLMTGELSTPRLTLDTDGAARILKELS